MSNAHGFWRRLLTFLQYALVASWLAFKEPADIVVASSGPLSVAIPGLVSHWLARRPVVFEVRDVLPDTAIEMGLLAGWTARCAHSLASAMYRCSKHVVALSPDMARLINKHAPQAAVTVIPNASDLDLFQPSNRVPEEISERVRGRFVVLYAGTLGQANDGNEIIELAAELERRGAKDIAIFVIGTGADLPRLQQARDAFGLKNIEFLGLRTKEEVASWHAAAALTYLTLRPLPTLWAGSPNKLFDSLAAGRPIIHNTHGWMKRLLSDAGCGVAVPPRRADVAADHVLELRDSPVKRTEMGQRARALAERHFSREQHAARFLDLLTL